MSILSHRVLRPLPNGDGDKYPEGHELPAVSRSKVSTGHPGQGASSPRRRGGKANRNIRMRGRSSVWREQVRGRLADLRVELDSWPAAPEHDAWRDDALQRLAEAETIVDRRPSLVDVWTGVDIESAWMRIHAIEVALFRISRPEVIRAKLPRIIDDGSNLLGENHPRVRILRACRKRSQWNEVERECLAHNIRAVYEEADKENVRLRSFRNVLLGATLALALLAVSFALFGAINPGAIDQIADLSPSGYSPQGRPAPSRTELLVIEMLGLISASLVGAVAIRHIQGTSTVYGVPMASLLLKLPTGALTALAGIFLIRADILPVLPVSGNAHLGAYALLFGASQQGFTTLVDRQANNVLSKVSSKDNG